MNPRPQVHLRGMGLSCSLGLGVAACARALSQGEINTVNVTLDGLAEAVAMPYYRIPDQAGLFDPGRFYELVPAAAREAIQDAGLSGGEIASLPIFVGSSSFNVRISESLLAEKLKTDPQGSLGLPWVDFEHVAATLQAALGIAGETYAFNTACSSAANALIAAKRMLQAGLHKHALVIGVELANRSTLAGFRGLQLLCDAIRPFDQGRKGIILGEAVSAVLLSTEGGRHGVTLCAGSIRCDTFGVTTVNPDGSTLAALQSQLLARAGVGAESIRGIKAHATSTLANDSSEAAGMRRAFPALPPVCALKPYTGHTMGACGTVELILLASALRQGYLPATPGFRQADPLLNVTPVLAVTAAPPGHYVLNYFGFGGNNSSLLIRSQG